MKMPKSLKYFLSILIVATICNPILGLDIDFGELKSYEVVPTDSGHLVLLKELRQSNSGLLFWNGIGELEEAVEFLASSTAMDHFAERFKNANLKVTVPSSGVELTISRPPSSPFGDKSHKGLIPQQASITSSSFKKSLNLVPVEQINGTKLYSGIFYEVGMKRFPEGWVTWTDTKTKDSQGNYIQIDRNPKNLPHYIQGQKWHKDIQWAFAPSKIQEGFFTLRNKGDTGALVTVTQETDDGYHHIILKRKQNLTTCKCSTDSVLWRPVGTSDEGLYTLKTDTYPEGTVTWTETKYGDFSHYLQMSLNEGHRPNYLKGAQWYDDTLFQFIPPKVELTGLISHFEIPDLLSKFRASAKRTVVKQLVLHNRSPYPVTRNITDIVRLDSEIGLTFNENLKKFTHVKGTMSLPTLTCTPFTTEFDLDSVISGAVKKTQQFIVDSTIEILPGTSTQVSIYVDTLNEISLPFKAFMTVSGQADRILGDYSGISKGPVPHGLVQERLSSLWFQSDMVNAAVDSTIAWVSGTINGSYVVDVGIDAKSFPGFKSNNINDFTNIS